ncbi:hypothetical protein SAMN04489844_4056 [Nocardioides exalbidus]|uniref:Uncharacterized protein n=1 Tax=Nocardioides exalbidus TaxID=402596 RepID=A0A1H4ZB00_9ACTN|nr:hypothetical protein [Nocardioides exalbidus]SED26798.1 hypothetical protein SAMN04489844_4056 [Nocardioides exalbidus]
MQSTLVRSAHADEVEAQVQRATCCTALARCRRCRGKLAAVRAWRRDALVHSLSSSLARSRPRRPAW